MSEADEAEERDIAKKVLDELPEKLVQKIRTLDRMGMTRDGPDLLYRYLTREMFKGNSQKLAEVNGLTIMELIVGKEWGDWYFSSN